MKLCERMLATLVVGCVTVIGTYTAHAEVQDENVCWDVTFADASAQMRALYNDADASGRRTAYLDELRDQVGFHIARAPALADLVARTPTVRRHLIDGIRAHIEGVRLSCEVERVSELLRINQLAQRDGSSVPMELLKTAESRHRDAILSLTKNAKRQGEISRDSFGNIAVLASVGSVLANVATGVETGTVVLPKPTLASARSDLLDEVIRALQESVPTG